jgi:hypothetical protein
MKQLAPSVRFEVLTVVLLRIQVITVTLCHWVRDSRTYWYSITSQKTWSLRGWSLGCRKADASPSYLSKQCTNQCGCDIIAKGHRFSHSHSPGARDLTAVLSAVLKSFDLGQVWCHFIWFLFRPWSSVKDTGLISSHYHYPAFIQI